MQKKGFKGGPDIHEAERQAAGLFSEKFPLLESMVIFMEYYQKGDNPLLMTRTLHVYPDRDSVFFHVPCLIHDCEAGSFDLTSVVVGMLKGSKTFLEGRLDCQGGTNPDIAPDHGRIQYRIEARYKSPETLKAEQEAARRKEEEAKREARAAAKKAASEEKKSAQAVPAPKPVLPQKTKLLAPQAVPTLPKAGPVSKVAPTPKAEGKIADSKPQAAGRSLKETKAVAQAAPVKTAVKVPVKAQKPVPKPAAAKPAPKASVKIEKQAATKKPASKPVAKAKPIAKKPAPVTKKAVSKPAKPAARTKPDAKPVKSQKPAPAKKPVAKAAPAKKSPVKPASGKNSKAGGKKK